ncbi:MAG: GMC oxidoreductase [Gammaproteobacteria bacterium]
MKLFAKREILPGNRQGEALDDLIRDGAMSMHHPTCTAKMGQDDLSVVDAQLRTWRSGITPPSEVMSPPSKDASIRRRLTSGKLKAVWVQFVTAKPPCYSAVAN